MNHLFQRLGQLCLWFVGYQGQLVALVGAIGVALVRGRMRWSQLGRQLVTIGFGSQLVVIITGAFTGAVLAAQAYVMFNQVGLGTAVGMTVSLALCRELGPVLTGLMLAGRVGAAMTAEIGTMKVTEQIDALRAMAVHPVDYLVVPRVFAMIISVPLLIAEAISFGLAAAYGVGVGIYGINRAHFLSHLLNSTDLIDIGIGMVKGSVFGLLIVVICCHQGLTVENGAVGVGKNTTSGVVFASLAILISNFFLTLLVNIFFPLSLA
ncbi:MAG TPA: ABC transporter permease [Verrucomicrobiales bacterium]|nr:ABC transporter permease [Verrucomicrobiales bacterium]